MKQRISIVNASIPQDKLGKGYLNKRTLLSVSSCGICGKQKLEDIALSGDSLSTAISMKTKDLVRLFNVMQEKQATFKKTGGSHAASVFDSNQKLLAVREDIGRHNAVDKVVGRLLHKNKLKQASILLVSGRVSYEIISKAFIAQIPIIAAVSGCSSLAVLKSLAYSLLVLVVTIEQLFMPILIIQSCKYEYIKSGQ